MCSLASVPRGDTGTTGGRTGRPREPGLDEAILAAAFDLLATKGLDRLRVQDVADEAGVGLASVYRRWGTKSELVIAAVNAHLDRLGILVDGTSGDPREELVELLERLVVLIADEHGELVPGLVATLRSDAETAVQLRAALLEPLRERVALCIARCVGGDAGAARLRADLALGAIIFRFTVMDEALPVGDVRGRLVPLLLGE